MAIWGEREEGRREHGVDGRSQKMELAQGGRAQPTKPAAEVTLRPFTLADVDAMMAWASVPMVTAPCRWEPYNSTEPLLAFLKDTMLLHPWFHAICLVSGDGDGRPVGALSMSPMEDAWHAELGYVLV
ncbi:uncharacterized protein LOC104584878 [Brachypodium distachyon]|uniref:uncharacterized protein LOC104584878 n=1 Tax=Brachypodium distachyon TaxID=15368 RepID=UPI00052FFE09|nr:uncharacterized protein LOC104584878 [Brachypodium distachyon]|eukprot:XP_010238963.1 uncharacterized protein LOC104584878 [Brachypodium distachyon]